jgi:hypothetical protein
LGHVSIVGFSQPWRVEVANIIDLSLSFSLMLFILTASAVGDYSGHDTTLSNFMATLMFLMFASVITGIAVVTQRGFIKKNTKAYNFYLCHHKDSAGAVARLVKVQLEARLPKGGVFLDSDSLETLDTLFDIVKTQVETFVVLATRSVLTRPWCAGEICIANDNEIRTVVLDLDGQLQSSVPRAVDGLEDLFAESDIFMRTGCQLSSLEAAFQALGAATATSAGKGAPTLLRLDPCGSYEDLVTCVEKLSSGAQGAKAAAPSRAVSDASILLVVDPEHSEAVAASRVIAFFSLKKDTRAVTVHDLERSVYAASVRKALGAAEANAGMAFKTFCFLLCKDCFLSPFVLSVLQDAAQMGTVNLLPTIVTKDWQFPQPPDLALIESGARRKGPTLELSGEDARHLVEELLKNIAVVVDMHGSAAQIENQVAILADRASRPGNRGIKARTPSEPPKVVSC